MEVSKDSMTTDLLDVPSKIIFNAFGGNGLLLKMTCTKSAAPASLHILYSRTLDTSRDLLI